MTDKVRYGESEDRQRQWWESGREWTSWFGFV